jgi:hypothetical protein
MNQALPNVNQRHTVKVNSGSGVLIQPMSLEYAYVLTAKHCLQVDTDVPSSTFKQSHVVLSLDGKEIPVLKVIHHDTKDVAILVVAPKPDHDLMINSEPPLVNDQFMLCGFPDDRRGMDEEYSAFMYKFAYMTGDRLIFSPATNGVVASNIVGFSGGGLFTLDGQDKPVLLCAIETKMDGNLDREYHGSISAIPISEFELLIADSQKQYLGRPLAPLLPLYLSNFEYLLKFSFSVCKGWTFDHRLSFLKDRLRDIAAEGIQVDLVPYEILEKFKEFLKVHSRPEHELRSRELWIALLELLTISILIDKPEIVDLSYVEEIIQSRRLIYIGVNETWQQHITEIFKAKLNGFNDNGIIVVKTLSSQREVSFQKERVKKLVDNANIARPPSDRRSITNSKTNLSKIHSIVDLAALHAECIEIKEHVFEGHTNIADFDDDKDAELQMMLAREYGAYLTVKDVTDEQ